jgi:uncharacterized protein YodC (DUF2158 family)
MQLNVGDVVRLRSGGPVMTVRRMNHDGVMCEWFDDQNHVESRLFEGAMLIREEEYARG